MFDKLGEQLLSFLDEEPARRINLVAPFIKASVVQRCLDRIPDTCRTCIYTRWDLEEIAAGVSDIEVYDIASQRGVPLQLCSNLHAKYYRRDEWVLVGSANLTATALDWTQSPNLELLVRVPYTSEFSAFEDVLEAQSFTVDDAFADITRAQLDALPISMKKSSELIAIKMWHARDWWPHSRNPGYLYSVYGGDDDAVHREAHEAALRDLDALALPFGLDKARFDAFVGWRLLQTRAVQDLDRFLDGTRRFGELRQWAVHPQDPRSGTERWQILMRWLLMFLPRRYDCWTANYSELFARRQLSEGDSSQTRSGLLSG